MAQNKKLFGILIILGLLFFYAFNNFIWFYKSADVPANFEESYHLYCLDIDYLGSDDISAFFGNFKDSLYGPVYPALPCLVKYFFGNNLDLMRMTNILWFALLLMSVYLFLYSEAPRLSVYGILIVSMYPAMYGFSRTYCEEFGLTAVVALFYYLIKDKLIFNKRGKLIILSFTYAIGMMLKFPFIIFTAPAMIYRIWRTLYHQRNSKVVLNITLLILLVFLLVSPRFARPEVLYKYLRAPLTERAGLWYDLENIKIYTFGIVNSLLSIPLFILFIFSFKSFYKRTDRDFKILLFLWLVIPWLFFVFMPHRKLIKYILPVLPVFVIVSAYYFYGTLNILKKIFAVLVLILGFSQYYIFSFIKIDPSLFRLKNISIFDLENWPIFKNTVVTAPIKSDFYTDIFGYINKNNNPADSAKPLLLIPQLAYYDTEKLRQFLFFANRDIEYIVYRTDRIYIPELIKDMSRAEYMLFQAWEYIEGAAPYYERHFKILNKKYIESWEDMEEKLQYPIFYEEKLRYKKMFIDALAKFEILTKFVDESGVEIYLLQKKVK